MTEGGVVAITAAITTTSTVATIAVAISSPPKPVFLKIMAAGTGGVILGSVLAALILRHYRNQIIRNDAISTNAICCIKRTNKTSMIWMKSGCRTLMGNSKRGDAARTPINASSTGLIGIIKSGSLDSLLTNPWLVSIFVATVISVAIAAIATTLAGQRSSELTPEQEVQQALLQKSQNLEVSDNNFREYLTRNDYAWGLVSNPGLLRFSSVGSRC